MSDSKDNRFKWPVIGHSNIINYLQTSLRKSNIAHSYLLVGPKNIGKTLVAQYFVNSLICENLAKNSGTVPCAECQSCRQAKNKIHPDVFWLERITDEKTGKLKKNISIEQVRELQNKLSLHSFMDSYKVAVIRKADRLSQEAANSLLKTLEEPTKKTVIILLTSQINSLPKTIASRCQVLRFLPVRTDDIYKNLLGQKLEQKKAKALSELSFGRPGIAIKYFTDNESYLEFQEQTRQFIFLLKGSQLAEKFKLVENLVKTNDVNSIKKYLDIWTKVLRDLLLVKCAGENLVSNTKFFADLIQIASLYPRQKLVEMVKEIAIVRRYLESNVNPRLTLENFVLNF